MADSLGTTTLVLVGVCYIDTILSVPAYPAEDEKLRATSLTRRRGGNVGNSLEVLQQLVSSQGNESPINLALICPLPHPTASASAFIKNSLESSVNLSMCVHRTSSLEAASCYIIQAKDTNSRTIVNYNDLDEITLQEFQTQVATLPTETKTWFHFEGRNPEISLACIRWLKQMRPQITISVEVEKPARQGLEAMAAEADVVFFAKGWAQANRYDNVDTFLRAQAKLFATARLLCCTWGDDGAAVIKPDNGVFYHEPAFVDASSPVVDTIGAGDTFVAGMLFRLIIDRFINVKDALIYANRLAGRKVGQHGFANLA